MTEEKTYTLRDLTGDDLFLMVRIVSKIGIDRLKACMESPAVKTAMLVANAQNADASEKEAAMNKVGMLVMMEIAATILERLPECKEEIYALLAQVSDLKREDIANMKLIPLTRMVKEFFKKPEFPDFFTEVFEFFK